MVTKRKKAAAAAVAKKEKKGLSSMLKNKLGVLFFNIEDSPNK